MVDHRWDQYLLSLAATGEVIVILTNRALIDRISPDRRRIKVLQEDIPTMSTNKIVAAGAGHSSLCTENRTI
jgi:hypothetical protein